jgi:hypothetical protein
MSDGGEPGNLHREVSERSRYQYFFYDKHHGRGGPKAARWSPGLSDEEEFEIFDQADLLEISDANGNLYGIGVGPEPNREVRLLGTLRQQIAKFPRAHAGAPWHGYPLGPLEQRSGIPRPTERALPKDALRKMVEVNLIDNSQRKRLLRGSNI